MSKQALNGLTLYFNEINKAIICKADMKKDFVDDLKERIGEFIEENPEANTDDIIAHFGQPEEIAKTFLETLEPSYIKKATNWKKAVFISAIIILVLLAIYLIASFIDGHKNVNGYAVTGIAEGTTTTNQGLY